MPPPIRTVCTPWVSLPDLPTDRPRLPDDDASNEANDAAWEETCWQASEVLFALTGRQFTGPCASTVLLRSHRPHERHVGPLGVGSSSYAGELAATSSGSAFAPLLRHGPRGQVVAALPGRPVTEVLEVTVGGEPVAWEADLAAGLLWRADGYPWPDGEDPARQALVSYRHGSPPPSGGVAAARTMALELAKAQVGDASCRLPQRVETLTRQGVTMGFRNGFESLDANRTGIWTVDAFITSVNPAKLSAPPAVFSPDAIRGRRVVGP